MLGNCLSCAQNLKMKLYFTEIIRGTLVTGLAERSIEKSRFLNRVANRRPQTTQFFAKILYFL